MGLPISGRFGSVNGQSTIKQWTLNETSDVKKFAASNTQGGMGARRGARDWNGSFAGYGTPNAMPNDIIALSVSTGDDGGGAAVSFAGSAFITQTAITWNFSTQEILSYVTSFASNGALTKGAGTGGDVTQPFAPSPCGLKIEVGAILPDVEQCVLTIKSDPKAYVNSDTVEDGFCWVRRRPGNIDWNAAITQQSLGGLAPVIQDDYVCKFYTSLNEAGDALMDHYELTWGHLGESTGITCNVETADITKRTLNLTMNGAKEGDDVGRILLPGGELFWGVAAS